MPPTTFHVLKDKDDIYSNQSYSNAISQYCDYPLAHAVHDECGLLPTPLLPSPPSSFSSMSGSPKSSNSRGSSSPSPTLSRPTSPVLRSPHKSPMKGPSRKRRNSERLPRPLNAFMLFRKYVHRTVYCVEVHGASISEMAGRMWNDLPTSEKTVWINKSAALAAEFKRKHPDWTFKPNKDKPRAVPRNVKPRTLVQQKKMSIIVSAFSEGKRETHEIEELIKTRLVDVDEEIVPLPVPRPKRTRKTVTRKAQAKATTKTTPTAPLSEHASQPDEPPSTESAVIVETPSPLPHISLRQETVNVVHFEASTNSSGPSSSTHQMYGQLDSFSALMAQGIYPVEQTDHEIGVNSMATDYLSDVIMDDSSIINYHIDPLDELFGQQQTQLMTSDLQDFNLYDTNICATDYFSI